MVSGWTIAETIAKQYIETNFWKHFVDSWSKKTTYHYHRNRYTKHYVLNDTLREFGTKLHADLGADIHLQEAMPDGWRDVIMNCQKAKPLQHFYNCDIHRYSTFMSNTDAEECHIVVGSGDIRMLNCGNQRTYFGNRHTKQTCIAYNIIRKNVFWVDCKAYTDKELGDKAAQGSDS